MGTTKITWADKTWAEIPGFVDYFANPEGLILSTKNKTTPITLSPIKSKDDHLYVFLYIGGKSKKMWVHRLILMTFDRLPFENEEGRHLDGNPKNNSFGNLAWGTKQQNSDDKKRHGRIPSGEKAGTRKLSVYDVVAIRNRYQSETLRSLAAEFGVSHTAIRRAALGIKWSSIEEGICCGKKQNRVV